ncbi:Membrane Protein Functionally coupled to the MukBEF Chromosome Partitioning Mechanism [hydrothermal vent metagenome]|uniref:Membrane Protein Functionally coupled to the MukBEF Chromosome Partitioning Mechanism n=1 Tax=hydrothermal vent metagenome TaxID=652676 RepID=A0A1W1E7G8_9ZZZZ
MSIGFWLKKFIAFWMMPLSIGMLLLAVAYWKLKQGKTLIARNFLLASLLWIALFSYDPFANLLLYPLEHRYKALLHPPQHIAYIYVLGGGHHSDANLPITSQIIPESVVRTNEGIRLYHALHGKAKLIVSGYHDMFEPNSHAAMAQQLALSLGIPKEDIILVPTAADTEDEAKAAKRIAKSQPVALVTSAYHMPRAAHWFKKTGVTFYPAPTYHLAATQHPHYLWFFNANALKKLTIAIHEYLGILWQKIKGA